MQQPRTYIFCSNRGWISIWSLFFLHILWSGTWLMTVTIISCWSQTKENQTLYPISLLYHYLSNILVCSWLSTGANGSQLWINCYSQVIAMVWPRIRLRIKPIAKYMCFCVKGFVTLETCFFQSVSNGLPKVSTNFPWSDPAGVGVNLRMMFWVFWCRP